MTDETTQVLDQNQNKVIKALDAAAAAGELTLAQAQALHEKEAAGHKRQAVLGALSKYMDALAQSPGTDAPAGDGDGADTGQEASDAAEAAAAGGPDAQSSTDAAAKEAAAKEAAAKEAAAKEAASKELAEELADKKARGEMPEWKKPDYTGPLTGEQAMWRNAHIRTK